RGREQPRRDRQHHDVAAEPDREQVAGLAVPLVLGDVVDGAGLDAEGVRAGLCGHGVLLVIDCIEASALPPHLSRKVAGSPASLRRMQPRRHKHRTTAATPADRRRPPMSKKPDVTLAQLRYFIEAATHLSMTRAAEELFVAQSAVSSAIAQLEQQV